jgi:signal transduction histidine kinase
MRIFTIIAFTLVLTLALAYLPVPGIAWHVFRWALYLPILLVGARYGSIAGLIAGLTASFLCALVVAQREIGEASWPSIFAPDFAIVGLLAGRLVDIWPRFRQLNTARGFSAVLPYSSKSKNKLDPNPFASIESAARLLAEDDTPANLRQELVGIISTECEHISASVAGLFERVREASPPLVCDADVSEIVDAAIQGAAFVVSGRGVVVRKEIAPDLPRIQCNPDQIRNLVMSLTVNAAQAGPPGTELVLTAKRADDGLVLDVCDRSRSSLIGRLVNRFLGATPGSTGAVLAAAFDIVRQHGGKIEAKANVRKGLEFSVWLPLRRNDTDVSGQDIVGGGRRQPPARHPAST